MKDEQYKVIVWQLKLIFWALCAIVGMILVIGIKL